MRWNSLFFSSMLKLFFFSIATHPKGVHAFFPLPNIFLFLPLAIALSFSSLLQCLPNLHVLSPLNKSLFFSLTITLISPWCWSSTFPFCCNASRGCTCSPLCRIPPPPPFSLAITHTFFCNTSRECIFLSLLPNIPLYFSSHCCVCVCCNASWGCVSLSLLLNLPLSFWPLLFFFLTSLLQCILGVYSFSPLCQISLSS